VRFQGGGILSDRILQLVVQVRPLRSTFPRYKICLFIHVLILVVVLNNLVLVYSNYLFISRFITSVI
jgi:hypothetical protein